MQPLVFIVVPKEGTAMVKVVRQKATLLDILTRMTSQEGAVVHRTLSGGLRLEYVPAGFLSINEPATIRISRSDNFVSYNEMNMVVSRLSLILHIPPSDFSVKHVSKGIRKYMYITWNGNNE